MHTHVHCAGDSLPDLRFCSFEHTVRQTHGASVRSQHSAWEGVAPDSMVAGVLDLGMMD